MKVLHDWDEVSIRVDWSRRRGISLLLYCLANKFPFLKGYEAIMKNTLKIENEKIDYMEILIKLDRIAGITPIFGIRDDVRARHKERIDWLEKLYGLDIRRHIHIGEPPDPDRIRLWEPPLNQSMAPMHFDTEFKEGRLTELAPGDLPVFHVDYPYDLRYYIEYIYQEMMKDV